VVQIKWTVCGPDVNRVTVAAIWEMFPIVCVRWWYFSRLFTRTAEVHTKTPNFLCKVLTWQQLQWRPRPLIGPSLTRSRATVKA